MEDLNLKISKTVLSPVLIVTEPTSARTASLELYQLYRLSNRGFILESTPFIPQNQYFIKIHAPFIFFNFLFLCVFLHRSPVFLSLLLLTSFSLSLFSFYHIHFQPFCVFPHSFEIQPKVSRRHGTQKRSRFS